MDYRKHVSGKRTCHLLCQTIHNGRYRNRRYRFGLRFNIIADISNLDMFDWFRKISIDENIHQKQTNLLIKEPISADECTTNKSNTNINNNEDYIPQNETCIFISLTH